MISYHGAARASLGLILLQWGAATFLHLDHLACPAGSCLLPSPPRCIG